MKLNVLERLLLMSILPNEANFVTLKIVRDLRNELSFSEEEHKKYKFVETEGRVTWNLATEQFKEVHIGEKANDIIVEALKELNDNAEKKLEGKPKLTMEHMSLYEKFIEGNK